MEIKRSIRSGYFLLCSITIFICFGLGYILTVSIDKVEHLSLAELYFSIYTVYTQFGMLIFSVLVIQLISSDYKEKNIIFYKLNHFNWLSYYFTKIGVALLWLTVPTIIASVIVCVIYENFSYFIVASFHLESVLIYEILITSLFGFLFKDMIAAYIVNLFFWLMTILLSVSVNNLKFFVYYDASSKLYLDFGKYLETGYMNYKTIVNNCLYTLAILAVVLVFVFTFRKRWERNGI